MDLENALKLISDTITENYSLTIKIPSTAEAVAFKPLSILQQKRLIAIAAEKEIYNSNFNKVFLDIIKENYLSENIIPISALTICDKLFIALALRININSNYNISDKIAVDLNMVQENLYKICLDNFNFINDIHTFNYQDIYITCKIPSLEVEVECDTNKTTIKNEEAVEYLQTIIAETVTNELSKYIMTININSQNINLSDYKFVDKKQIIEQLPAAVLEKILLYILEYKQTIEKALTYSSPENPSNIIQIDSSFFATA